MQARSVSVLFPLTDTTKILFCVCDILSCDVFKSERKGKKKRSVFSSFHSVIFFFLAPS